jgi:Putative RNA methylase family UPF0020
VRPITVVMVCPAGFEEIAADAARQELSRFVEDSRSSGFIRGHTVAPVRQLRAFPCATNVFCVLDQVPRSTVDHELRALRHRLRHVDRPIGLPQRGTLRLRVHDDGQFTQTSGPPASHLERALASWSGLDVSRRGAVLEVWLLRRTDEPYSVLATKLSEGRRPPERGVLRPEICAALARVEPIRGAQSVIDPFAGSGAIGDACLEAGAKWVWLNDMAGTQRDRDRVRWTHRDIRDLAVPRASVDAIVTDPPWGHFSSVRAGTEALYADLGRAAAQWLQPHGAIVALSGAPEPAVQALLACGGLALERAYPVLVNGRKALVIRARRQGDRHR